MPKTVSAGFTDAFAEKVGKEIVLEVRYRRRYFDTATQAFKYESSQTTLRQNELGEIGEIQWNLDIPFANKFTASNVSLFLKNTQNEWIPSAASPSIFAADTVAPNGYVPELTEFQILWGYRKADGTVESVALFTGLATEFLFQGKQADVEVVVTGRERLLQAAEAAKVSDSFSQESTSPATGDSSTTEFFTTSTGVGRITEVRVGGVVQDQGDDYEIEDLNLFGKPAKITFTSAPPNGAAVDASGIKWKTDKKIEELVGLLMDEAGILAGERTIDPVTFPAGVDGKRTWDSKADWDGGTVPSTLDTVTEDGSIILAGMSIFDDFNDGSPNPPPRQWSGASLGSYSFGAGFVQASQSFIGAINTPSVQVVGTWEIQMQYSPGAVNQAWYFMMSGTSEFSGSGYGIVISNSVSGNAVTLERRVGGSFASLGSALNTPSGLNTYRVTRDASGNFKVYFNGTLIISATDLNITTSAFMLISRQGAAPGVNQIWDTVRTSINILTGSSNFEAVGIWESDVHDTGVGNPQSYGNLDRFETLDGDSSITYETRTSDDGAVFDPYVALGAGGAVQSTTRRFIQVRATLNISSDTLSTPHLERLVLNFTVGIISVKLAIHEGKTVFEMIEVYAQLSDFEFGFLGDGNAFFRSKVVSGSPLVKLTQEDGIVDIEEYKLGLEDVRNVGQVKYGPYFNEFDGAAAGEASPTSEQRFGRLVQFEDLGDILLANDVNLAAARARSIYETRRLPRKLLNVKAKMVPHLDLADIVRLSFFDNPLFEKTIFGDPLQTWAGPTPAFGDAQNILARDLDFKVVGIRYNPEAISCDLTLQEVLS